jgi:Fic family protein
MFVSARSSALLLKLIEELFQLPVITTSRSAKLLNITPRSAQLNINKLVKAGIVSEVTGRERRRIYVAKGILDVLQATKP